MIEAANVGNVAILTSPRSSCANAAISFFAAASALSIVIACAQSLMPASVSRMPLGCRTTSGSPTSRSSLLICWETAEVDRASSSAAAERLPVR